MGLQIIIFVGLLELYSESSNVLAGEGQAHYMRGGKPGFFPSLKKNIPHPIPFDLYDPFGFSKKASAEKKAKGLRIEVNNGRLAMLGIMAFLAAGDVSLPFVQDMISSGTGVITGDIAR